MGAVVRLELSVTGVALSWTIGVLWFSSAAALLGGAWFALPSPILLVALGVSGVLGLLLLAIPFRQTAGVSLILAPFAFVIAAIEALTFGGGLLVIACLGFFAVTMMSLVAFRRD